MDIGQKGERFAAQEYFKRGYQMVAANIRVHLVKQVGEIDLIMHKDRVLVFIEVKTRTNGAFGYGVDAVNYSKRRKLIQAVKLYLAKHPQYGNWLWRIDVAEVNLDKRGDNVIILENVIEDLD
jgi:putative endonuclease